MDKILQQMTSEAGTQEGDKLNLVSLPKGPSELLMPGKTNIFFNVKIILMGQRHNTDTTQRFLCENKAFTVFC